jgi:VanZ family protein
MQPAPDHTPKPHQNVARIAWLGTLAIFVAMFVGTHMPPAMSNQVVHHDKMMHFWAYMALAFGVITSCDLSLGRLQPLHYMLVFIGCAIYGAIDELTQIPVGRVADTRDWIFDIAGVFAGLALYRVLRPLVYRLALWMPAATR